MGSYHLIYQIKHRKLAIILIDIGHRKEIYR
ncbi:MAG: hypothetical protein KDK66_07245 [Deltaproteobacteria bacterium]|nr:hypothetical protein [Deltaproteobacteria bacterium]